MVELYVKGRLPVEVFEKQQDRIEMEMQPLRAIAEPDKRLELAPKATDLIWRPSRVRGGR